MRIAQIAPLEESVPPRLYGGTERVIAWLTEELVQLGHEVTLFASADSQTTATLIPVWSHACRLGRPRSNPIVAQTALVETVARHAQNFDLMHWHTECLHLPLCSRLSVPSVTTLHGRLDLPGLPEALGYFPHAPFISISNNQQAPLANVKWLGTVYHGLPPNSLQASFEPGNYLAFLGRLAPEKGPETAIRLAKRAGMSLRIAAKLPRTERSYFEQRLRPLMGNDGIQFIGEITGRSKEKFLAEAAALLFPIEWPEPFGLVMIEAMACGTPVIAFRRGAVPEVIEDGVTGFIVENEAEALRAIERLPELDRRAVRNGFERRFSARRMAQDYVRYYRVLKNML
jgi:glycosyltransferase involved in cell wall biosynthesis